MLDCVMRLQTSTALDTLSFEGILVPIESTRLVCGRDLCASTWDVWDVIPYNKVWSADCKSLRIPDIIIQQAKGGRNTEKKNKKTMLLTGFGSAPRPYIPNKQAQ